jgi:hypothetical protein
MGVGEPLHFPAVFHGTDARVSDYDVRRGVWFISDEVEALEYGSTVHCARVSLARPMMATHEEVAVDREGVVARARRGGFDGVCIPPDLGFADTMVYYEARHCVLIALVAEAVSWDQGAHLSS